MLPVSAMRTLGVSNARRLSREVIAQSRASLLTGRYPYRHGVRDNEIHMLGTEEVTLAKRLREAGWRSTS